MIAIWVWRRDKGHSVWELLRFNNSEAADIAQLHCHKLGQPTIRGLAHPLEA